MIKKIYKILLTVILIKLNQHNLLIILLFEVYLRILNNCLCQTF